MVYMLLSCWACHVITDVVRSGGLLSLMELLTRLERRRGASAQAISVDDVRRAIEKVQTLGKGFGIVHVDNRPMILSVPTEFNRDHTDVLAVAQVGSL